MLVNRLLNKLDLKLCSQGHYYIYIWRELVAESVKVQFSLMANRFVTVL